MSLTPSFQPPRLLRNAHLQSILNSQGPRLWRANRIADRLPSEMLTLQAEDGTRLTAELDRSPFATGKLVILLHGWEGCSRSAYMLTTTERLLVEGYDVLRLNLRDHGDTYHLNREIFNSTRSPEVASALQNFSRENRWACMQLVGFSLGASFALRVAADAGEAIGIESVVAVCPPTDPSSAMKSLNSGLFIYRDYFFKRWHYSLSRKLKCFPEFDYGADLARAKSLDDLNRIFIPRYTDYETVEDYFAGYALVGDRLSALRVPAWLIATEDDPIIPVEDHARIDGNSNLRVEIHPRGGHCGFIESFSGRSWIEDRIVDLIRAVA